MPLWAAAARGRRERGQTRMEHRDVIVVGGGVSGLAFAYHAAAAGKAALVVEAAGRLGGCVDTRRSASGYWFEMGAHTCYNSYRDLIEIIEGCGLRDRVAPRGEARKRFALLRDGKLTTMGPLSVFRQFDAWELLRSAPSGLFAPKQGKTTYAFYSGIVGKRNYHQVLGPFLAAVPSQSADAFPAVGPGSLFKKRPRRKDVVKSFTMQGGLGSIVDGVAGRPRVEAALGATAREVRRAGAGYEVALSDGRRLEAPVVALAVPPSMASAILRTDFPELSGQLARIGMAAVDTLGVTVAREKVKLPEVAFLVPFDDIFFSAVSRDVVPDPARRAFAFHYKTGHPRQEKVQRACEVMGVREEDLEEVLEKTSLLPSPVLGHGQTVEELDRMLAGGRLALTGNYFAGLAIEDCVARSKAEWERVAAA